MLKSLLPTGFRLIVLENLGDSGRCALARTHIIPNAQKDEIPFVITRIQFLIISINGLLKISE